MEQTSRPTEVRTDSDTRLFLQVGKSETETASGKRTEFVGAITLSRETGTSEDGEQTTFLNAHQIEELIEELSNLRGKVIGLNRITLKQSEQ